MAELAAAEILTPELLAKLGRFAAETTVVMAPAEFAEKLRAYGVGLVDADRMRCLVDENVYAGALHRGRRWMTMALAYLKPALPDRTVWQELSQGMPR